MASAGDRWTQKPQYRVGLLVLERKRDGFDVAWGKKTRGKCWEALVTICGNNGYALKPLNGDHERVADDRSLRRALQKAHGDVDVVVATQPTISDGRLAAVLAQACAVPVVLWATPENPDVRGSPVGGVSSNSLVGTHLFAATLRQLGRRDVELVYADQDWSQAASQLSRAIARAAGTARIKTAKIGLIGHQAPGFVDLCVEIKFRAASTLVGFHTGGPPPRPLRFTQDLPRLCVRTRGAG